MSQSMSTYAVWGWGAGPSEQPQLADLEALGPSVAAQTGVAVQPPERPAPLRDLPTDRVTGRLPRPLAALASGHAVDRARHGLGRSYRDVVRGIRGRVDHVPDTVLRPTSESEVAAVLEWCVGADVAVVPFGGGSSVVGGVEPDVGPDWTGVISLDLGRLTGMTELDATSRVAQVRAGTLGPDLETALRRHGLTARFYPQSFERSTVGGWIATRAAGHFSTGPTHIDDLVESVRALTPAGGWESRRVPGSGAGASPDRLLLGSEGSLGVITSAWLRVQPRPTHRWSGTFAGPDLTTGAQAVRSLLQSGMRPATCRAVDAGEAAVTGTLATGEAVVVAGLESWSEPVEAAAAALVEACRDAGLRVVSTTDRHDRSGTSGADTSGDSWRSSFVRAPYLREQLVLLGLLVETFETAVVWRDLDALIDGVTQATTAALHEVCGTGTVTCRLTHAYPDGAAPYFTVIAPARRGSELAQWAEVKTAASEAILAHGGTITHHHAVGRDHASWYARQRPAPFGVAMAAVKAALDPRGVLNPGVMGQTRLPG